VKPVNRTFLRRLQALTFSAWRTLMRRPLKPAWLPPWLSIDFLKYRMFKRPPGGPVTPNSLTRIVEGEIDRDVAFRLHSGPRVAPPRADPQMLTEAQRAALDGLVAREYVISQEALESGRALATLALLARKGCTVHARIKGSSEHLVVVWQQDHRLPSENVLYLRQT